VSPQSDPYLTLEWALHRRNSRFFLPKNSRPGLLSNSPADLYGFSAKEVAKLLFACKRRCYCICHRFCGITIETDHILPKSVGGTDDIENAISLCFECHAEAHLYNDKHPRGRKYTSEELKMHKDNWIELCKNSPQLFVHVPKYTESGPLSSLITELEFNCRCSNLVDSEFETNQFQRAMSDGRSHDERCKR
jgi:hypothetical protein